MFELIQKVLLWAYVGLGIGAFCYWISAVLAFFRMLSLRAPGKSLVGTLAGGFLRNDSFTPRGVIEKSRFIDSVLKLTGILVGMVVVVVLGIATTT